MRGHPLLVRMPVSLGLVTHVLTDALSLLQTFRAQGATVSRRYSGPRRITLARLVTRPSSGPSPSLPRPPVRYISTFLPLPLLPHTHAHTQHPSPTHRNAQVTARVDNGRLLTAQPKDLPPARRPRPARAGRTSAKTELVNSR